jgi:hypothetical protein
MVLCCPASPVLLRSRGRAGITSFGLARDSKSPAIIESVMPINEADPVGHLAVEALCVHRCLDDRNVPRADERGETYSLWGRVCAHFSLNERESEPHVC